MHRVRTIEGIREALTTPDHAGRRIGLVPTMGALHEGHLSLIRAARRDCDVVVVSVFVNPTQFNDQGDLAAYPRDEERDAHLASRAGADLLFVPDVDQMYPPGDSTTVSVRGVSEPLEGAQRGVGHFDGVATVVTKLFIAVGPDVAYFGQKDAQQVAVVQRLVADLALPVTIEVCPTVREPDGLAMSSRNVRLHPADRQRALALKVGLDRAAAAITAGSAPREAERQGTATMMTLGVEPEYLAVVDPATFLPAEDLTKPALAVVAAPVGDVRLIDNLPIPPRDAGRTDHP
ncbi:pantoate--beta-alanine ligase [Ornithinimicrobium sp. F0845]|uniref:pantoate--beta-alanine ligase n=1 Tax=Ornithinimicrobium sp. F0845 TaxID=2926412 RepID=UPI001FF31F52|nr:pantoate--beta-alanine ligase [Ornithinimicrobium sp. F0845]MCK0112287.1 pantoate--beta-alanine ligase [Ornithinimicrobium sp. F0845]